MRDCEVMDNMLEGMERQFFGKYRGNVVQNEDLENPGRNNNGRIQVIVPAVMGDCPIWAMPCVPYAGKNVGFFALPEPGTGVWIEFEAGDPSYPNWVGCFKSKLALRWKSA